MSDLGVDTQATQTVREFLDIDDVSTLLQVSKSLLAKWRMHGGGPRFIKVGRRILYDRGELRRWLEGQTRSRTGEERSWSEGENS